MVHHQVQDPLRFVRRVDRDEPRPQRQLGADIEAAFGVVPQQAGHLGRGRGVADGEAHAGAVGGVGRVQDHLFRDPAGLRVDGPEDFVAPEQGAYGGRQRLLVERPGEAHRQGDVVVGRARVQLVQEPHPGLGVGESRTVRPDRIRAGQPVRERDRFRGSVRLPGLPTAVQSGVRSGPGGRAGPGGTLVAGLPVDCGQQAGRRGLIKEHAQRQFGAEGFTDAAHHGDREQGMPAQDKEVIAH